MNKDSKNTETEQCTIPSVTNSALVECYWCYEHFKKDETLTVHSAEFGEPSFPICKKCNEEHDVV
jgi:hypothetical protein